MEIKNTNVYGLIESAVRSGYPMRTDEPSDSFIIEDGDFERLGRLAGYKSGSGHDNALKGIIVQFDIKYTQYFTPQLQRYNFVDIISSQSKMHRLTSIKNIKPHCNKYVMTEVSRVVNNLISIYNDKNVKYPSELVGMDGIMNIEDRSEMFEVILSNLPMGYEMWMGITTNYLQLKTIYNQRKSHRLSCWRYFCKWIESLPMMNEWLIIK